MINSARLLDFQAHKDTLLEFGAGVNVIVGDSDKGKSSIIRAMRLVLENRPGGNAFIRHGRKECTVELGVDEHTVGRDKGKLNRYTVDDTVYAVPKTNVPDEVAHLLNIKPLQCQWQHDPPFMLGKAYSAGEVAKMLNEAVRLDDIDIAMYRINSMHLKTKSTHDHKQKDLAGVDEQLKAYDGLDEISGRVAALEEQQRAIVVERGVYRDLHKVRVELGDALEQVHRLTPITAIDIPAFGELLEQVVAHTASHRALTELRRGLVGAMELRGTLGGAEGLSDALDGRLVAVTQHTTAHAALVRQYNALSDNLDAVDELKTGADELQAELDVALVTCPLCGRGE